MYLSSMKEKIYEGIGIRTIASIAQANHNSDNNHEDDDDENND